MDSFELNKKIMAAVCFAGFLITISAVPFIYVMQNGGLGSGIALASVSGVEREIFADIPVKAKAFAIYDTVNKEFIYSKNGNAQLPLASITKVMSGLTALRIADRLNGNQDVKFSGKWWGLTDLLKFSLVSSSNSGVADIASAMSQIKDAENKSLINVNFVGEMNGMAKELGLKTTYFINETGLDVNIGLAGAYGSAKDTAKMFAYAIKKYPEIYGATKNEEFKIISKDGEEKVSKNTNLDVAKMTSIIASKTGTTDLAGGNLVIAFDAGLSHPIIISLLGSTPEDRFNDAEKLAAAAIEYLAK